MDQCFKNETVFRTELGMGRLTFAETLISVIIFGVLTGVVAVVVNSNGKFKKRKNIQMSHTPDKKAAEVSVKKRVRFKAHRSVSCCPMFRRFAPIVEPCELNAEQLLEVTEKEKCLQENPLEYGPGGYMPISYGQTLHNDTYKVIRKLGFGHFSTVWLCLNQNKNRYEALKIVKSSSMFKAVALDEIQLLKSAMRTDPSHFGYEKIIQMYDHFTESSVNGTHICMSFELMGPSLFHLIVQSDYQGLQLDGVRTIIKQVLQGLVYLHQKCKIIHTDIKPENILICVKDSYVRSIVAHTNRYQELGVQMPRSYVSALGWEEHVQLLGDTCIYSGSKDQEEETQLIQRSVSHEMITSRLERSLNTSTQLFVDPNIEVKIADLGNSCWEDYHFSTKIQTVQYRALEVIIDANYSFPADIWSVGCMAFELATGEYLFNPNKNPYLTMEEDHLGLIWELLDGIPSYVLQKGPLYKEYFDNSGNFKHISTDKMRIWKLEDVLVEKYKFKRVDAILFAGFIQGMVEPDPELRTTASSALLHSWMMDTNQ